MAEPQPLQIEFDDTKLPGLLHAPDTKPPAAGFPALLVCDDPLDHGEAAASLLADIARRLRSAGIIVAHLDRTAMTAAGGIDNGRAPDANDLVDQISALYRALALREDVDLDRIGLLGYSLGAVLAMKLAQRTNHIARCCLLSPRTTASKADREDDAAARLIDELASEASLPSLAGSDRPLLVIQGAAERLEPAEMSLAFGQTPATDSAPPTPQHVFIAQGDHAYTSADARTACLSQITVFFAPLLNAANGK